MECDRTRAEKASLVSRRAAYRIYAEGDPMIKTKGGYLCDRDGYTGHVGDQNPFKHQLPHTMVLKFEPVLRHSIWIDLCHRYRTMGGLLKHLQKSVRLGQYVGYRFITIHKEVKGIESRPATNFQ
jgi:hypothetical protein